MNAAFLLVTSAMLVGQPAAEKKPVPPPATSAVVASSSCGQDSCDCEGFGHRLRGKLRGLFNRDNCDSCQPTTCHTHAVRTPHFKASCDDCKPKIFNWQPRVRSHGHGGCDDGCDNGGFLGKLRARFHRGGDACCDGGCGTTTGTTVAPPVKSGEKIEGPKKMPDVPKKDVKKTEEVRIENQPAPFAPNAIPVTPTVPTVEIVPSPAPIPVPAPRVEGSSRRDPF